MKRPLSLLPPLLYMALIFHMSSHPVPEMLKTWPIWNAIKLVHLVEYGILASLWAWGLRHATNWTPRIVAGSATLFSFLWGVSDEYHQAFVPSRTAKLSDALTDLLAAAIALALVAFIRAMKHKLCYNPAANEERGAL